MSIKGIKPEAFLRNLPLFAELGASSLAHIAASATKHRLARGATLFRRGDAATGMFVVVYGEIKLVARTPGRGERLAGIVGAGRSFGEPVMFLEKPYILDAQALTDALVLHIPKTAIFTEIERNPRFARRVIAGLSKRIESLARELESYALGSAIQRLIAYLLRLRSETRNGEQVVTLPAAKAAIASQLNLTAEHFSRLLHELAGKGLLRIEGRRLVIPDIARLRARARRAKAAVARP